MNKSISICRTLGNKRIQKKSTAWYVQAALIASIAVFLIPFSGLGSTAFAAGPGPLPPGPQLPVGGKLCMNYGHATTGKTDMAQATIDFNRLSNVGIKCLRLAYKGLTNTDSQAVALLAKSKGMSVIMGGDSEEIYRSDFAKYDREMIAGAKWAQTNGIPQISIGNEQEYELGDISQDEWVEHLKSLAAQVHTVYSGKVSYETSSDFLPLWKRHGLGSIDLLGLNNYCGFGCNGNRVADAVRSFGYSHVYVSETNADMATGLYNSDLAHAARVTSDLMALLKIYPVPMYYFTYSTSNSGGMVSNIWGLYNGNTLKQPLTAAVLGIRY